MGWSFAYDTSFGRQQLIEKAHKPGYLSPGYTVLRVMPVGNNLWYLYQTPTGGKTVGLTMMAGGGRTMGWGEKGIDENCGPSKFDCPLALIDNATAPESQYAYDWRQKVRRFHAAKKARKAGLIPGCVVTYGIDSYVLQEKLPGRRGWRVRSSLGHAYRMSIRQIAQAQLGSGVPA